MFKKTIGKGIRTNSDLESSQEKKKKKVKPNLKIWFNSKLQLYFF